MRVFILGYPGDMGGANTEAWHTIKLWRRFGIDVHLIPTWGRDPKWEQITRQAGCVTHIGVTLDSLQRVDGIRGSIVIGFCNDNFLWAAEKLIELDCKLVWVNCMTYCSPLELNIIRDVRPFHAMIYQSEFQRGKIEAVLEGTPYSPKSGHLIRGAFDFDDWKFNPRPHNHPDTFFVGRAARPDPSKWSSNTWPIYRRIQYPNVEAIMLGVTSSIQNKLGQAPEWGHYHTPMSIPTKEFYNRLHCLFPINGGAAENWPRVGLEAFASGVPVVTQDEWGWKEMIEKGVTGFLAYDDCEMAHWVATIAYDESLRQRIIKNAYERLRDDLANPNTLFDAWRKVFEKVGGMDGSKTGKIKSDKTKGTNKKGPAKLLKRSGPRRVAKR